MLRVSLPSTKQLSFKAHACVSTSLRHMKTYVDGIHSQGKDARVESNQKLFAWCNQSLTSWGKDEAESPRDGVLAALRGMHRPDPGSEREAARIRLRVHKTAF